MMRTMLAHGDALQWSSTSLRALEQSVRIWRRKGQEGTGMKHFLWAGAKSNHIPTWLHLQGSVQELGCRWSSVMLWLTRFCMKWWMTMNQQDAATKHTRKKCSAALSWRNGKGALVVSFHTRCVSCVNVAASLCFTGSIHPSNKSTSVISDLRHETRHSSHSWSTEEKNKSASCAKKRLAPSALLTRSNWY